jgi:hypothetical protein
MTILKGEFVFAAKVEATYGVDVTPDTTLNAMRVKANIEIAKVDLEAMDYDAGRTGAKGSLEKRRWVEGSLEGYLAGSGTAVGIPAIAPLMQAAGLKLAVNGSTHVDIELDDISNAKSVTGKFWRGTAAQTQVGARCDWEIELSVDSLPRLKFPSYKAIYQAQVNGAKPATVDLTAFTNPLPTDPISFVTQSIFGFDASISKVTIKGGNEVIYMPESASVQIVDRKVTIDIEFKEPTPDVKDFYELIGTYGAIDLQHGQDTVNLGNIFEANVANAQLINVSSSERNKMSYLNCSFECVPTAANNEITMKHR